MKQYPFARIWIDSPHNIPSHLRPGELAGRLIGTQRYAEGRMKIVVRRGWSEGDYVIIALQGNSSNGFQRFFFCRLVATETGSALVGEIRTRAWARGFLAFVIGLWFLFLTITVAATLVAVSNGRFGMVWSDVQFIGIIMLFGISIAGFGHFSMAGTAANEDFLLDWLRRKLA